MRLKSIFLLFFLVFAAYLVDVKAISYGYSLVEIDQPNTSSGLKVYVETGTVLDYDIWYWYDPGIQGYLFEDSSLIDSTERIMNFNGPVIYLYDEFDARYNSTYRLRGDHYLGAYHSYVSGGQRFFYDRFGFGFYSGEFPTPYTFLPGQPSYRTYQVYRAASTQVTLSAARPLHLASIDATGGVPGATLLTMIRGAGFFGNGNGQGASQTVQVSGNDVTATVRPTTANTIEVLEVEISISSNADVGDRNLTLTVNGQASNSIVFRVGDRAPQITSITPPQGNAGDQVSVTISGTNFGANPDVEIAGLGLARNITSATSTQIEAIFSVAATADPGTRGVKVRSRGVSGTGFLPPPGVSDASNIVPFDVLAQNPRVIFPEIGSIEKGQVKPIMVRTENAPPGHVTKLRFKNQPAPPATRPPGGWKTGEARFVNNLNQDVTEISYTGDQQQEIRIRGWERSTSTNNIDLEARFNDDPALRKEKSFTISSIEFSEEADCTGYDDVEYQRTRAEGHRLLRYFYVPQGGSNRLKVRVSPSGAIGAFRLEPQAGSGITISQPVVSSTNDQVITISASANAQRNPTIEIKAENANSLTNVAEYLLPEVLPRKNKNVVIYAVKEDNDDVQVIPRGQGAPNTAAYVFTPGVNNFIDTIAGGDDFLAPVPIGQRPPGYDARSRKVFTGENGILETMPQGDDERFESKNQALMLQYAPVIEFATGAPQTVCIRSGANQFLDTLADITRTDDREAPDPLDSSLMVVTAGANGRCDTDANDDDVAPPTLPNVTVLQNYLNNTTWGRQANIFFTVTVGQAFEKNFDLNRNGELKDGDLGADEVDAISLNDDLTTLDLYYVGMRLEPLPSGRRAAITEFNTGNGWFGLDGLTTNTAAHELGHLLGRTGPAQHSPLGADYQRDLMYESIVSSVNQCRIRKPDWQLVHLTN